MVWNHCPPVGLLIGETVGPSVEIPANHESWLYLACLITGGLALVSIALWKLGEFGLDDPVASFADALKAEMASFRRRGRMDGYVYYYLMGWLSPFLLGLAVFGLAGYAGSSQHWDRSLSFGMAMVSGGVCTILLGRLVWMDTSNAPGRHGTRRPSGRHAVVIATVPGNRAGSGRIGLEENGRTVERDAITSQSDLPIGSTVLILEKVGLDTYAVAALPDEGPTDT